MTSAQMRTRLHYTQSPVHVVSDSVYCRCEGVPCPRQLCLTGDHAIQLLDSMFSALANGIVLASRGAA
jgi:hypothetical protein